MSVRYPFTLSAIAASAGPIIERTETTCRFVGNPDVIVRLENGYPLSWVSRATGHGGGVESLALKFGLPLPDPQPQYGRSKASHVKDAL